MHALTEFRDIFFQITVYRALCSWFALDLYIVCKKVQSKHARKTALIWTQSFALNTALILSCPANSPGPCKIPNTDHPVGNSV